MRALNSDLLNETMDADQGGSDFINSLPTPEIKTTEDLIAAATPAAPKPTDAMLRGKKMSQTQFEGMEPVYESTGPREGQRELLGYKYGMSQVQEPGMTASYSTPVYEGRGRGGAQVLVDPGGKLLGYEYTGTVEVPKPAEILAREKQFGTTMEPIYATTTAQSRGADRAIEYGPPIGYRFDNGKSQYVNFDANGTYQNTQIRESGGFANFALSVLSIAYPPAAPFIQAYNAIKAIDSGDTLGFILNAAGAGRSIPGLDASTVKLLNEVKTGAGIIAAVKTGDPLKIASSMVSLPGVPVELKDTINIVNTAKSISRGNINALIGLAQKYGGDVSKTANKVTLDGTTYDTNTLYADNNDTGGDSEVYALGTSQIIALGGTPRYVPIQSVDADNPGVLRASDALSALIEKNGVQEDANIGPVLVRSEEQDVLDADGEFVLNPDGTKQTELVFTYYSDIKLTDNQGNSTGYRTLYDPVTGKTAYQLLASNGETSTSRLTQTPPFFNVNTGRYTDEKPITQVLDDAGLVSDDSVDIIKELEPLTTTDLTPLTTTDVAPLTTTDLPAITTADVAPLTTTDLTPLTTTDVAPLTTADVAPLTTADVSKLSTADVSKLSTADVAPLTTADVAPLTTADVSNLSTADVSKLSTADVSKLTTTAVDGLSTKDLGGLTTTNIGVLGTKDLSVLGTKDLGGLTTTNIGVLGTKDLDALTTTDLTPLTTKVVTALTTQGVITLPKSTDVVKTNTTVDTRKPTPSQAQRLADAFAVPTLANTFYGNADFSTKRVKVDDEGNIIEVPYEPIDVSRPASKSLLANGGQITDNSTDPLVALLNHIMGSQDKNQLTEDDLLDIVRKGI